MAGINNKRLLIYSSIIKQQKPFFYFGPVVHRAAHPTRHNMHGIWTFKSLQIAAQQEYIATDVIIARVGVFGKVLEYENIYRSSHIIFDHIYVPDNYFGHVNATAMSKRYQCPVDVRVKLIDDVVVSYF